MEKVNEKESKKRLTLDDFKNERINYLEKVVNTDLNAVLGGSVAEWKLTISGDFPQNDCHS